MFRRCISLLIIAGVLAGQLAEIPHAHGGMSAEEQRVHDLSPHIHCHSHQHHSQSDHSQSDHSQAESTPPPESEGDGNGGVNAGFDWHHHAADSVEIDLPYQSLTGSAVSSASHVKMLRQLDCLTWAAGNSCPPILQILSSRLFTPPASCANGSDLYLTTCKLRI